MLRILDLGAEDAHSMQRALEKELSVRLSDYLI